MPGQHVKTHIAMIVCVCLCLLAYLSWFSPEPDLSTSAPVSDSDSATRAAASEGAASGTAPTPAFVPTPDPESKAGAPAPDYDSAQSLTVVVNKHRPLTDRAYVPADLADAAGVPLRAEAASAYLQMSVDAAAAGVGLTAVSGFRAADAQGLLHDSYTTNYGVSTAEAISARAGFSEHQTGLAVDIGNNDGACSLQSCFAATPAGAWAAANAHRYGFIIRYPDGAEHITGFTYEPWHLRYVGPDVAQKLFDAGITLEEYAGLPAAPGY
ncbi:M15 family metallopeptidase [Arthrobacter sp. Sa2CUA1]|uniref:M15 family metallopeptidase n=1 Tax=Arthrobacter gallicola TaxID=2762225 RepID=A0ABR8UP40_9MICC|nr:M15 family metallopeptidase [Arthrobacter gallicola]MBD7994328.1 M15 family metallopeptidase [Arthrobacter gallicola]